jgi:hypothetical protein
MPFIGYVELITALEHVGADTELPSSGERVPQNRS